MFNKKYILVLLLLIVSICAISTAWAADDDADVVAADEADDALAIDEATSDLQEDLQKADEKSESSQDDSILNADESGQTLSLRGDQYKIELKDEYMISSYEDGNITYYRDDCRDESEYAYHYFICVFDQKSNILYEKEIKNKNDYIRGNGTKTHTISKNSLSPGTYTISFINCDDAIVLDSAVLKVSGTAKITASDYNSVYKSNNKMDIRINDQVTGKPMSALKVNIEFTKGSTVITRHYKTNSKGKISFVPHLQAGVWSVKITPKDSHIAGSAIKLAVIKKANVVVTAMKVAENYGYKTILKATVKTKNGKTVDAGKVVFRINGKNYYANVKKGKATYKVNLKKIKKYSYSAKFMGTNNLFASGKVYNTATLKKSFSTKVYPASKSLKVRKYLSFTVKPANGKKVSGKLQIKNGKKSFMVKVKKGKGTFNVKKYLKNVYKTKKGKISVYYIPTIHLYRTSKMSYRLTR